MPTVDSSWGYAARTLTNPSASGDSGWWYGSVALANPAPSVGDSSWAYGSRTLSAPGAPLLMVAGQPEDIDWQVLKAGVATAVKRWYIMQGGVPVPLVAHAAVWSPPSYVAGADPIGTASYAIPSSGVIYVAPSGSNSNPGTSIGAPKQTLAAALDAATSGSTIVLRSGAYHEGEIEAGAKAVTIQPYPGETVWFDGSAPITGWVASGAVWVASYTPTFDRQLGKGSGISTWAGGSTHLIVDQVWLDDVKLTPVPDGTTPGAGQFSVNQSSHTLTIGSDPTGKEVRSADLKWWMAVSGATIRGIGVRRYSPHWIEYRSALLMAGAGTTLEQVTIQDSGLDALSVGGAGITIRRCTFQDCRHSGVMGDNMDSGVFEQNIIRRCNQGGFDDQPATAGWKMTRTFAGLTFRFNHIESVPGAPGVWTDTTVSRFKFYGNTITGCSDGLVLEASDGGVYGGVQYYQYIVGNRMSGNTRAGVMASISGHVRIWNNDIAAAVCIWSWQDYRENTGAKPSTEGTVTQSPWHCENIDVVNNALQPTSPYYTQLRLQTNSDAAFKTPGGAMLERFAYNWVRPQGSGLFAYISDAAGSTWSTRSTLASLETTTATYGGPLTSRMAGNYQGDAAPAGNGMAIQADVAAACGIPAGHIPAMGAIWPTLTLAG